MFLCPGLFDAPAAFTPMTACSYPLYILVLHYCIYLNARLGSFLKLALKFVRCVTFTYEVPDNTQPSEGLHSSEVLCSLEWKLLIDVLGQPTGPIFKGLNIQKTA
jgi:hypothetical protein